jgi:hypothetical protein
MFKYYLFSGLVFSFIFVQSSLAQSSGQTWCAIQYLNISDSTMTSLAVGLGQTSDSSDEICQDAALHLQVFESDPGSKKLVSATAYLVPVGTDPVDFYKANTWSRPLNDSEKDLYYCVLSGSGGSGLTSNFFQAGGDWLINLMPSSPDAIKIPNQIVQLTGEGTLASNLRIELYSAGWQTLAIFCLIKFYKLIPFKST